MPRDCRRPSQIIDDMANSSPASRDDRVLAQVSGEAFVRSPGLIAAECRKVSLTSLIDQTK